MKLILTNTTASAVSVDLPDGGIVPANSSRTWENIEAPRLEQAMRSRLDPDGAVVQSGIDALVDAGTLTVDLRPDDDGGSLDDLSDLGDRLYYREFQVTVADLDAAAVTQTIEDAAANAFPARARLRGYILNVDTLFAGGASSAATVDIGIAAGESDVLSDGADVFTGAATGERYGSGTNTVAEHPVDLGGKRLRVAVTSDVNVDTLTTGDLTVKVWYSIH